MSELAWAPIAHPSTYKLRISPALEIVENAIHLAANEGRWELAKSIRESAQHEPPFQEKIEDLSTLLTFPDTMCHHTRKEKTILSFPESLKPLKDLG